MNWIDYAILGVIALSTLISLLRGFVKESLSLVIWALAFFISSGFYQRLASLLDINDAMLRNAAAIAILFVLTIIVGSLVSYMIGKLVEKSGLSGTDRVLGSVFGAMRGVLVATAVLFFMDSFTAASSATWWIESMLIPEFKVVIEWFFEYLKSSSSFLSDIKPA